MTVFIYEERPNPFAQMCKEQAKRNDRERWSLVCHNPLPVYINGVLQSREDIVAFERSLRSNEVIAFGKCVDGNIYYTTKGE